MKKTTLLKSMFLLCALIVGSTCAWADAKQSWDLATATYSSSTESLVTWSSTNVTFTAEKNGGTSVNNYLGGTGDYTHTRLYNKNLLTFTPLNSATITSIVITTTGSSYTDEITGGTKTNCAASAKDAVVTITPTSGTSACSVKLSGTTRITKVDVNYTGGSDAETATASFSVSTAFISIGDKYTNTLTTSPDGLAVSYSTEDSDIATINSSTGQVTGIDEGIVTITASWVEQTVSATKYAAGSQTYVLYVGKVIEDGVFDFTGYQNYGSGVALSTSTSTYQAKDGYVFTAGKITLTTSGDDSKYFAWYPINDDKNELRFYTNTSYTLAAPDGYVITNVAFTGKQNVEKMTVSTGTLSGNNTASTWTGRSQTVKFTRGSGNPGYYTITVNYEPVSVSGTISASGWNTFSCEYPLDLSTISGGTAYYASAAEGSTVTLTTTTAKVPAGEGLMIKGTLGETFTIEVATSGTAISGNKLIGLPTGGTVAKDNHNYVFGWSDPADPGFYLVNDKEPNLAAGKAYLHADNLTVGARLSIDFGEGDVTAINKVEAAKQNAGEYYNLSGQRVAQPTKGLYIVNGRKVVIK